MAILTQGTNLYFVDPEFDTSGEGIVKVNCATSINTGGNPVGNIELACLESFDMQSFPGLRTPGQASIGIKFDPAEDSHIRLHRLSEVDPPSTVLWVLGWSDGKDEPTIDTSGEVALPNTRSWLVFEGYVADCPFDFQTNTLVDTQITIQRSGKMRFEAKGATI